MVKIWDVASGDELTTLRGHDRQVTAVVFHPDGERVFSTTYLRGVVKEWDVSIDRNALRFHGASWDAYQVAFSPDGKRIAGSSGSFRSQRITLWDAVSGAEIMTFDSRWEPLAFSPDGKRIVASGRDRRINIWNAVTGSLERTLTGHDDRVFSVGFSPDSTRVVSGGKSGKNLKVWNAATGDTELTIATGKDSVNKAIFSTDGKRIISGGADGTVRIWDALSGAPLLILYGHEGPVRCVSVSSDGHRIASCGDDKTVRLWDTVTGSELMTLCGHESSIRTVAFSPDDMRIISGGNGGQIKIWDAGTGTELIDLGEDPARNIISAVFSPDGKSVCAGIQPGGVKLWESVEPASGYGPRQTADAARDLVDVLYKEDYSYDNAISKLEEDNTINDAIRTAALHFAKARQRENAGELDRLTKVRQTEVVFSPDHNEITYREALEKLEEADRLKPDKYPVVISIAAAQYRLGAFEEALTTLARARTIFDNVGGKFEGGKINDLTLYGFRAMALQQLGRDNEANTVIRQLRGGYEEWFPILNRQALRFVIEVEKLFAGQDSTLASIWELIGEDELDQAADLVEEVHLSKNAERRSHFEDAGAAKALSTLYYIRGKDRWKNGGESSALIADYERAVRIDPNNIEALTELGRIYVNRPDPDIRDAKKAVEAVTRACELTDWKGYETINILAAACSEAGDLEDAIKWQNTALELLPGDCPAAFKANYQAQLDLYESGKPYNKGGAWSFSHGERVSHWEFDEGQAGEVFDSTGKGHRGRLVGDATIVSDPERGHVLKLGRKGDYVDCGWHPGFKITGAMTIAVWIKVTELNSAPEIITTDSARLRLSGGSEFSCKSSALYKGGGVLGTKDGDVLGTAFGQESQWHLIVVRYEGEELNFYIDGEPTSSAHWTANRKHFCGNIQMDAGPLTIGPRDERRPKENPKAFKDLFIDDVRIYSYALTADEVKNLYEGKEPPREKTE
jgi:WD40 repeat protein/Flp pilus assembly protein TadD